MIDIDKRIEQLLDNRGTMIIYMYLKAEEEDWHGVCDSANDLRDIDTEIETLRKVKGNDVKPLSGGAGHVLTYKPL